MLIETFCASLGPRFRLLAVNATGTLTAAEVTDALSVNARSALARTVVVAMALLFAAFASGEAELTLAVALMSEPSAVAALTANIKVAIRATPGAMLPLKVYITGDPLQLPPPATLPETKLVFAGTAMLVLTPVAALGPLSVTVTV